MSVPESRHFDCPRCTDIREALDVATAQLSEVDLVLDELGVESMAPGSRPTPIDGLEVQTSALEALPRDQRIRRALHRHRDTIDAQAIQIHQLRSRLIEAGLAENEDPGDEPDTEGEEHEYGYD